MNGHGLVVMNPGTEGLPYLYPFRAVDGNLGAVLVEDGSAVAEGCVNHVVRSPHRLPAILVACRLDFLCCLCQIRPGFDVLGLHARRVKGCHIVIHNLCGSVSRKSEDLSGLVHALIVEYLQIIVCAKLAVAVNHRLHVCQKIFGGQCPCCLRVQKHQIRSRVSGNTCLQLLVGFVIICLCYGAYMIFTLGSIKAVHDLLYHAYSGFSSGIPEFHVYGIAGLCRVTGLCLGVRCCVCCSLCLASAACQCCHGHGGGQEYGYQFLVHFSFPPQI